MKQTRTRWQVALGVASLGAFLLLLSGRTTRAASNVTISTVMRFTDLDASDGAIDGIFNVSGDLTIANQGAITCDSSDTGTSSGCPIRINVAGNMEIQAGGSIHSNTSAPDGSAGSIRSNSGRRFSDS